MESFSVGSKENLNTAGLKGNCPVGNRHVTLWVGEGSEEDTTLNVVYFLLQVAIVFAWHPSHDTWS